MRRPIGRILELAIPGTLKRRWIKEGMRKAFLGGKFYCPCCESHIVGFLPFGLKLRLNARCPVCSSLERHRLIWLFLKNRKRILERKGRLLHVAPESIFFRMFGQANGIEYVPVAKFGDGIDDKYPEGTMNVDITDSKFPDNYFDYIICNHVLEHIPDDSAAMRELYRILKPGGWAILQVPLDNQLLKTVEDPSIVDPAERERLFGQKDHVRIYGRDYPKRLESAGFGLQIESIRDEYSFEDLFLMGVNADEEIYCCHK